MEPRGCNRWQAVANRVPAEAAETSQIMVRRGSTVRVRQRALGESLSTASTITSATSPGTSFARKKTWPGIVTTCTFGHASRTDRSWGVSPPPQSSRPVSDPSRQPRVEPAPKPTVATSGLGRSRPFGTEWGGAGLGCSCSARQGRSREEDPPCSAGLPLDLEWTFARCSLLASRGALLRQRREGQRCASRVDITRDGRALEIVARVNGRGHVSCCLGELQLSQGEDPRVARTIQNPLRSEERHPHVPCDVVVT